MKKGGRDLTKVVSKYIGETEKQIGTVFAEAEQSGAALLFDEADALLGKRSEVKDAHDRFARAKRRSKPVRAGAGKAAAPAKKARIARKRG